MKRLVILLVLLGSLASANSASANDPYWCTVSVPSARVLFFVHARTTDAHDFCSNFRGRSGYRVTIQSSVSWPFSWQQRAVYYTPVYGIYAQVMAPKAQTRSSLRLASRLFPAYDAWRRIS